MSEGEGEQSQHVRLFAAVLPPHPALSDLDVVVKETFRPRPGTPADPVRDDALAWTLTSAWHVTLAFYGDVDEAKLPDLSRRLQRAASRYEPMTLRLAGAGRFGKAVLWMGVDGDLRPLGRLAASALACGRRIGLAVEDGRRFRPHITLARSSKQADLRPYVAQLLDYSGPAWTATDIALVQSHLGKGPGGRSRYEVVATMPLSRRERR